MKRKIFQIIQIILLLTLTSFTAWLNMGMNCRGGCQVCKATKEVACEYDCGKCYVHRYCGTGAECAQIATATCCKNLAIKCRAKFREYKPEDSIESDQSLFF